MSKVAEYYYDLLSKSNYSEEVKNQDVSELSEKEKCLYYGISCSYGICSECDLPKGVSNEKES